MHVALAVLTLLGCALAAPGALPTSRPQPIIVRGLSAPPMEDTLAWARHKLAAIKRPMDADQSNHYSMFFGGFKKFMSPDEAEHLSELYKRDSSPSSSSNDHVPRDMFDMGEVKRERARRALAKRQGTGTSAGVAVNDYYRAGLDSQYSGPISVGTPAQVLPVLFDLGSAAIYVPTSACTTVICSNQAKYTPRASSTFVNTSQRAASLYQQGGALGYIIRETVGIGPYTTPNFTMLAAVYVTNGDLSSSNPDANQQASLTGTGAGILGLSYSAFSTGTTQVVSTSTVTDASQFVRQTLVGSLVSERKLPSNIMGLFLQRAVDSGLSSSRLNAVGGVLVDGSELCIGCTDSSRYTGDLNFVPLSSQIGYWILRGGGFSVNGQAISGTSGLNVVLDSGFTLSPFPTTVVASVASAIGATRAASLDEQLGGTAYAIACSATFQVAMSFGGVAYQIDSRDLVFPVGTSSTGTTTCALTLIGLNDLPTGVDGIAGMSFLKSVYTVYNYDNGGSVGMAPSVRNTGASLVTGSSTTAGTAASNGSSSGSSSSGSGSGSGTKSGASSLGRSSVAVSAALVSAVLMRILA